MSWLKYLDIGNPDRAMRLRRDTYRGFGLLALVLVGLLAFLGADGAFARQGLMGGILPQTPPPPVSGSKPRQAYAFVDGSGFSQGKGLDLVFLSGTQTLRDLSGHVDAEGRFSLERIPLMLSRRTPLTVRARITLPQGSEDSVLFFTFSPTQGTLSISGKASQNLADIVLSGGMEGQEFVARTRADWSGGFVFNPVLVSALPKNTNRLCVDMMGGDAGRLCLRLVQDGGSQQTWLANSPTAPGGTCNEHNPYSLYCAPDPGDCEPSSFYSTELSVCDDSHMDNLYVEQVLNIIVAFMEMTEQLSVMMIQQIQILGTLIDAKQQLEVQRWFQEKSGDAHRDYHPSHQMCVFATLPQDLVASHRKTLMASRAVSEYMLDREKGAARFDGTRYFGTGAPFGPIEDKMTRMLQFFSTYCDPNHNVEGGGLGQLCGGAVQPTRVDKDINFTRTLESRLTLNLDFTNEARTEDETDILSLSKYLFAHTLFTRPTPKDFDPVDPLSREARLYKFMDVRSLMAIRGVARNSYGHLVGMRAAGTGLTAPFMNTLMLGTGLPDLEILQILGAVPPEVTNLNDSRGIMHSYFAQMEVLTKKIYQSPHFYTHLYDKPVNVERIGATLQAIKLMHDRDRFEAALRREMLVSMILETRLRRLQGDIDKRMQLAFEAK